MLEDLTPAEIVVLVQIVKAFPENALVFNDEGELTFLRNLPVVKSLGEKINQAGEREDVKQYIEKYYGNG